MRTIVHLLFLAGVPAMLGAQTKTVTWTGWFSDAQCAPARVKSGVIAPNNPECVKSCIQKGAAAVFLSEQAKAMFKVKDYPDVIADLGWRLEITASLDEAAGTISIQKVNRLSYQGASCGRPRTTESR
jgi:hypothetical protein